MGNDIIIGMSHLPKRNEAIQVTVAVSQLELDASRETHA
jgi:hypothetical protein